VACVVGRLDDDREIAFPLSVALQVATPEPPSTQPNCRVSAPPVWTNGGAVRLIVGFEVSIRTTVVACDPSEPLATIVCAPSPVIETFCGSCGGPPSTLTVTMTPWSLLAASTPTGPVKYVACWVPVGCSVIVPPWVFCGGSACAS
jgi:hypothetical protein